MTVFKYELSVDDVVELMLPVGAELLTVAEQHGKLMLWARVDPQASTAPHRVRIAGTGHPNADGRYVGTVLMHAGRLVLHVFDLGPVFV